MPLFLAVGLALSLLPGASAGWVLNPDNAWVVQEDIDAAEDALKAVNLYCDGGFKGEIDQEGGRSALEEGVGGSNTMLEILKEAPDQDGLSDTAAEKITVMWLMFKAGSIVFTIILLIVWGICCWTACPCCRCCRRCTCFGRWSGCEKRKKTSKVIKGIVVAAGCGIILGIIIAASMAFGGYNKAVDGFDNMACTSAKLLNGTLGGQESPYFIGMLPLLNEFFSIEKSLDHDSTFMNGVRGQLDLTLDISRSVGLASATFTLLRDAFSNIPQEIADNKHKCEFCNVMISPLEGVIDVLNGGIAAALDAARKEVGSQLSPEMSASLQKTFKSSADPLTSVKELVRNTFGFFTDTDQFLQVRGHLDGDSDDPQTMKYITMVLIVLALLLSLFMLMALVNFAFRETYGLTELKDLDGEFIPKYSKVTHRCAGCTWCCAWFYAILAFLVGGIMVAVNVPLAGMCLIMDDLSVDLLKDISPAIGMNLTGDQGDMLLDIIDKCFVPADLTLNPALVDILTVKDNDTAPKLTLREKIIDQVKDQIASKFDEVDAQLNSNDASLSNVSEIKDLLKMLDNPIDMMIIVDPDAGFESDDTYKALFLETALQGAFVSSVKCGNGQVSAEVPVIGNQTMLGVNNFVVKLEALGSRTSSRADCADLVTCSSGLNTQQSEACVAANNYVLLKQRIRDAATYRCDVFVDPVTGLDCDPLNMVGTFNSATSRTDYTSSCMDANGTMVRKQKMCTLSQFTQYIKGFATRVDKAMKRIDDTVDEVGTGISVGLRQLVDANIVGPIETIASGVTCGFLSSFYREMVNGFCYQGVYGFYMIGRSYVGCGVMAIFMTMLMYGLWRRSIDNVNMINDVMTTVVNYAEDDSGMPADAEPRKLAAGQPSEDLKVDDATEVSGDSALRGAAQAAGQPQSGEAVLA